MEVVEMTRSLDVSFWSKRRVFLTGHTGFKGSWTALMLEHLGACVTGFALPPDTSPSLFHTLSPWPALSSHLGDIRDLAGLDRVIAAAQPEIVIHMAAQPLVRRSYAAPKLTIETNVMGTVHLLEALREVPTVKAVLIITTDKVYENREAGLAFTEDSPLGSNDPYSASKAAVEILARSYGHSFFVRRNVPVACARAGNVIGGGDWAEDRLIPDLWRGYISHDRVVLRHPDAVRPWQHVLEPLFGYLLYIEYLLEHGYESPLAMNFGPRETDGCTVREVAERFKNRIGGEISYAESADPSLKESGHLAIDPSLARDTLGWESLLSLESAINWTLDWYKACRDGRNMRELSLYQLLQYLRLRSN
jgi:CDP-glucose 4,6-dehydratase